MAQSSSTQTQWREPEKGENAGIGSWNRPNSPYDDFMESRDEEDRFIRVYEATLKHEGVASRMADNLFKRKF